MDGGTLSVPAVFSAFNATLRIASGAYELKAVGEQTRDLLNSTEHISSSLKIAKTIRRQKSIHLDPVEKKWMDNVLVNTERTLNNVAALIEPARVDMQTRFGRIGLLNRGLFVFRDSPKVETNLARLNLASQSLHTVMNILCTREGQSKILSPTTESPVRRDRCSTVEDTLNTPPPYEESEFLNRRRKFSRAKTPTVPTAEATDDSGDIENAASAGDLSAAILTPGITGLGISKSVTTGNKMSLGHSANQSGTNGNNVDTDLTFTLTEILSTPEADNKYEGADGLQVCDESDDTENRGQDTLMSDPAPAAVPRHYPEPQAYQPYQLVHQTLNPSLASHWPNQSTFQFQPLLSPHWQNPASQEKREWSSQSHTHLPYPDNPPVGSWQQQQQQLYSPQLRQLSQHQPPAPPPPPPSPQQRAELPSPLIPQDQAERLRHSQQLDIIPPSLRPANGNGNRFSVPAPSVHASSSSQDLRNLSPASQRADWARESNSPQSLHTRASVSSFSTASTLCEMRGRERRMAWLEYQSRR